MLTRLLGVASCLLLGMGCLLRVLGLLVALGELVLAPRVLPDQHLPHPLALALAAAPGGLAHHDELALGPGGGGHLHEPVRRGHRPRQLALRLGVGRVVLP